GCDGQLPERALQADDGVLEDVVGLLPAVDLRIALEHLAREAAQAFAGIVEQLAAGGLIAAAQAVEIGLDLQRLRGRIGHATTAVRGTRPEPASDLVPRPWAPGPPPPRHGPDKSVFPAAPP